jgi:Flp pilus assembly protein TadD
MPDAIARYKAALEASPRSQAARMALSYALSRSGEPAAARAAVREAATAPAVADEPMDGWLAYHLGASRHLDEVVRAMKEELRS